MAKKNDWPRKNDLSRRLTTTIKPTDHEEQLSTTTDWPRYDSAPLWLTRTRPCATFDICGHVWAESFHCFTYCERTMRCVHCKTTCVYITFRLTKTCMCVTINTTLCFPPTFPSTYLNSHTTMWLFYLRILFNIPILTYETMSEYIGSTGGKDC